MQFEHRDLHPGNILIREENEIMVPSIIDFTLSRCVVDGGVLFADLEYDPEIFESQGEYHPRFLWKINLQDIYIFFRWSTIRCLSANEICISKQLGRISSKNKCFMGGIFGGLVFSKSKRKNQNGKNLGKRIPFTQNQIKDGRCRRTIGTIVSKLMFPILLETSVLRLIPSKFTLTPSYGYICNLLHSCHYTPQ